MTAHDHAIEAETANLAAMLVCIFAARRRLTEAEQALDQPWCPRASLKLDAAIIAYENALREARERTA